MDTMDRGELVKRAVDNITWCIVNAWEVNECSTEDMAMIVKCAAHQAGIPLGNLLMAIAGDV